jgi:hypothetical protein
MKVHNGSYKLVGNENWVHVMDVMRDPIVRNTLGVRNAVNFSVIG